MAPVDAQVHGLALCLHCGTTLGVGQASFCCTGCELVHGLLHREGLTRYYDLRGEATAPAVTRAGAADRKWLEPIEAARTREPGPSRVVLDVQGLHCAACVWLLEELFRRESVGAGGQVVINPALGTAQLWVDRSFPLARWVRAVESFGYRLGVHRKGDSPEDSGLLLRAGICIALAMNAMIFSFAIYAGLNEGPLHRLFLDIVFALSAASVVVGGPVFFRSAAAALRRGVLHMDLPIALGILLAFASSTYSHVFRGAGASYLDTLNVFIALMLVGRWLQERVVARNRRMLLADDGVDELLARRVRDDRVELVPLRELGDGDRLVVAPGDLVPVAVRVEQDHADVALDWISGESEPRRFGRGETIPAGAFNVGGRAITARAVEDFARSALPSLLTAGAVRGAELPRATLWWRRFAGLYVASVLIAAGGCLAWWLATTGDWGRALDATSAVLIVTCPCALGIATPLGYELVQAGLRRAGLFVRTAGFLDRALAVRQVVFDKTGTLTTGELRLSGDQVLAALGPTEASWLYNLVARSAHPKSQAIRRALADRDVRWLPDLDVVEEPGRGLALSLSGHELRLEADGAETVFCVDGQVSARFAFEEELRLDAAAELRRLAASGRTLWILSGDEPGRVKALARTLGVPGERALGACSPSDKAAWIDTNDRGDVLLVGDGVNDAAAVARAHCAGTPAIDRPFLPARADFFFTTPGLRPVRLALDAARALSRVVRRNVVVSLAYNVLAVALAYRGVLSPLACAVLMPASSITVVLATTGSLSKRSRLWRS